MPFSPAAASNPQVQRFLRQRRHSDVHDSRIIIEGLWAHHYLLSTDAYVETVLWCPQVQSSSDTIQCAAAVAARATTAWQISAKTAARISRRNRTPELLSLVSIPKWTFDTSRIAGRAITSDSVILVADGVEYAGNLGSLIRTVDGCGATALAVTNARARLDHPEVFNASRGTVLTTPIVKFSDSRQAIQWCEQIGATIYLTESNAQISYRNCNTKNRPSIIVVGSEGSGISSQWYCLPHTKLAIPMRGRADSLNVAVAAAIMLYEACANHDADQQSVPST